MCGRGRQTAPSAQAVAQALQVPIVFQPAAHQPPQQGNQQGDEEEDDEYSPFNNGAPGRSAPIVVEGPSAQPAVMRLAKWGLIPAYQSPNTPPDHWKMFNAREDNLVNVHMRLLNSKRCVVPLEGFFEWENRRELGKNRKVPYFVSSPTKPQLPMAGLWDTWKNDQGKVIDSFTIITVAPSTDLRWLHDRMPAILRDEEEVRMWLNEDLPFSKVKHLIRSYTVGGLKWWPVTESIGKLGYQGDDCIKPVDLVKGTKPITNFFGAKKKTPSDGEDSKDTTQSEGSTAVSVPEIGIKTKGDECVDLTDEAPKSEDAAKPKASPTKETRKSIAKSSPVEDDGRKKARLSDFFSKKT